MATITDTTVPTTNKPLMLGIKIELPADQFI